MALRTQVRAPDVRHFASKRANEQEEWNYKRKKKERRKTYHNQMRKMRSKEG